MQVQGDITSYHSINICHKISGRICFKVRYSNIGVRGKPADRIDSGDLESSSKGRPSSNILPCPARFNCSNAFHIALS